MVLTNKEMLLTSKNIFFAKNNSLKNKVVILLFALFFGIMSPLLLTDSIIESANNLRREYLLSKKQNTKTIEITNVSWNALQNKQEIYFNNNYYDVQKVIQNKLKTRVTIIQDNLEGLIKNCLAKNTNQKIKNKKPITLFADYNIEFFIQKEYFSVKYSIISSFITSSKYYSFIFLNTKPPIF